VIMKASNTFKNPRIPLLLTILLLNALFVYNTTHQTRFSNAAYTSSSGTPGFSNFEVAGNPFITGYGVGTTCPNTSMNCVNTEGEPQIRSDQAGNFYASSENVFCVIGGLCGGTFAWKSTDGGNHFTTLPLPNSVSSGRVGISPAGGDTDIAVAPSANANGLYNVYVASLQSHPPLLDVYVSTSRDGGATWSINPTSASIPVDDREWIAADGANKVCISYHAFAAGSEIGVNCSYDAGNTFAQLAPAFDANHQFFGAYNNVGGNIAIDPNNHIIYDIFVAIGSPGDVVCDSTSDCTHSVWVAVSIDGGKTFTDYPIYINPTLTANYDHQFPSIAIDRAGNVFAAFTDNHNTYYSFSTSFGQTWSTPQQVNSAPANTAIFPWITAGSSGAIDIVYYGTSYYDGVNPPDNYPSTAAWNVYFAQNLQALKSGSSFTQVTASSINHYGAVCESGTACTGNRDLLDDFGVAASPTTGLASIIYTDDQFVNSSTEPANPFGSRHCTPSGSNTVNCSHTDIATQTSGSGLILKQHHFEAKGPDFEQISLSNGSNVPDFNIQGTNTGDLAITSLSIQISGLPLSLAWSSSFPLQPGQSATASTGTIPAGIILSVGSIYSITVVATLSEGTTETQTINAIYTLGAGLGL
jgi:hypothetical protein